MPGASVIKMAAGFDHIDHSFPTWAWISALKDT